MAWQGAEKGLQVFSETCPMPVRVPDVVFERRILAQRIEFDNRIRQKRIQQETIAGGKGVIHNPEVRAPARAGAPAREQDAFSAPCLCPVLQRVGESCAMVAAEVPFGGLVGGPKPAAGISHRGW